MIIDTHAHYDDDQFDADRDEVLAEITSGEVGLIVNACASYRSWERVLAMTEKYPYMYAMLGLHPDHVGEFDEDRFQELKNLCANDKVVAIGEIGLDYYWDKESHEVQKEWFVRQLDLARELGLPVNIHSREAAADTMEIMREHGRDLGGIIHCYSYSKEMALEYVKMGYYIGVGGVVTFKNGRRLKETVEEIPLTSIVLETDCPYLAPEPNRGKRNNSSLIRYVAQEIARLKDVTYEEVLAQTEKNARNVYVNI